MKLYIGNQNYSSWSMRPWLVLRHFELPFEEVKVRFDGFGPESEFKRAMAALSPTGNVPVLVDGDLTVWDSLAIVEYLAERFPARALWPREVKARARARSAVAEMHAGFTTLRRHFSHNLEASLPEVGARVLAAEPKVRAELARVVALWRDALGASGGPFLFGEFSIADAFYAPICSRLRTYALPLPDDAAAYSARVFATPAMAAWVEAALAEHDFREFEEPYRTGPS